MTITDKQAMREKFEAWAIDGLRGVAAAWAFADPRALFNMQGGEGRTYYIDDVESAFRGYCAALEAAEAARDDPACPNCKGSGETTALDGGGPDAYEVPVNCGHCGGTGAAPSSAEQPAPGAPRADERMRFESAMITINRNLDLSRSETDDYVSAMADWAWRAWQARAQSSAAPSVVPVSARDGAVTDEMVHRFLAWKLPETFSPDGGVRIDERWQKRFGWPPTGTNLFNKDEARAMLEHVLATSVAAVSAPADARDGELRDFIANRFTGAEIDCDDEDSDSYQVNFRLPDKHWSGFANAWVSSRKGFADAIRLALEDRMGEDGETVRPADRAMGGE